MVRILDIDLDFFVQDVAYMLDSKGDRLDEEWFPSWPIDEALSFLEDRCRLTSPLPGWVVEHHSEAFGRWRDAIRSETLQTPFHVTHVDAHADLGLGDAGYIPLLTHVLYQPVEARDDPDLVDAHVDDGNWLSFAVACRWISDMAYVHNDKGGNDLMYVHHDDDGNLELKATDEERLQSYLYKFGEAPLQADRCEPVVPFRRMRHDEFVATDPYDFIVLCRSPGFTPKSADVIFDEVRRRFIDETMFAGR